MGRQLEACPACGMGVPRAEMNNHLAGCKAAREMMGVPATPPKTKKKASTARPASRGSSPRGSASRGSTPRGGRGGSSGSGTGGGGKAKAEPAPELQLIQDPLEDGRVPCVRCGRAFAADRIVRHQFACHGAEFNKPLKAGEKMPKMGNVVDQAVEKAGLKPVGRAGLKGGRPSSARAATERPSKWKVDHERLQEAMRAAREGAKLDKLKESGLLYFNGTPKPGGV